MVAKSLSTSQRYGQLHAIAGPLAEFCQALFPLLVAHSDDFGRLPGDVYTVKHLVMPATPRPDADVGLALQRLHEVQLIQWYQVNGRKYIQIEQFDVHQPGLHKRTASAIPEPLQSSSPGNSGKFPEIPGNSRSRARAELKRTEENRTKERKNAAAPPSPPVENSAPAQKRKDPPSIPVLAAMILRDGILAIDSIPDQAEAAKCRAAQLHLSYSSRAIANALASAQAQAAKNGRRYES